MYSLINHEGSPPKRIESRYEFGLRAEAAGMDASFETAGMDTVFEAAGMDASFEAQTKLRRDGRCV